MQPGPWQSACRTSRTGCSAAGRGTGDNRRCQDVHQSLPVPTSVAQAAQPRCSQATASKSRCARALPHLWAHRPRPAPCLCAGQLLNCLRQEKPAWDMPGSAGLRLTPSKSQLTWTLQCQHSSADRCQSHANLPLLNLVVNLLVDNLEGDGLVSGRRVTHQAQSR